MVTKERQSLRFKDSRTGVDVVLVGTMHYNPGSIELAAGMVKKLADADDLAAIVLETCPSRWAKTQKMQPPGTLMRNVLDNEFQAATEAAGDYDAPVVLGDQRIEDLGESAKSVLKSTWRDFSNPLGGGWGRLLDDWKAGYAREVTGIPGAGLTAADLILDWRLAISMPVSLFRYPLAWTLKSPKVIVPFFSFVWGLEHLPDLVPQGAVNAASGAYVPTVEETAVSALFLVLDVLEVVFLSRLFLKALLEVRNDILVGAGSSQRSTLRSLYLCKYLQNVFISTYPTKEKTPSHFRYSCFARICLNNATVYMSILKKRRQPPPPQERACGLDERSYRLYPSARSIRGACVDAAAAASAAAAEGGDGDGGNMKLEVADVGAVVAVLGAAHLNGVQLRLMEGEEEEEEGC